MGQHITGKEGWGVTCTLGEIGLGVKVTGESKMVKILGAVSHSMQISGNTYER